MERQLSCRCCLRGAPDKDLTTPYTHLGNTEIYSDMLAECFDINLKLPINGGCGICDVCVGRLRDASDFKLQVQRSQIDQLARLEGNPQVKDEIRTKQELSNDGTRAHFIYELVEVKQELFSDDTSISAPKNNHIKSKSSKEPATESSHKKQQPKGDGVPIEERRGKARRASQTCLATSRHGPRRASRMKDLPDDTAGLRAEEPAYTCDTCGKHFASKSRVICHFKSHEKPKDFTCEVCNKQFKHKCHLVDHRRIHTGDKPFSCETCGKRFGQRSALIVHKRIHTGEKPYSCDICNKCFVQISGLYTHKRIHAAKGYICDVCEKAFSQKSNFNTHRRIHTGEKPYHCEFCKKQFAEPSSLKRHRRIHTGEKPYSCETCNMEFREFSSFSRHKRVHTGEKPYSCETCNKQFGRKTHLDRHKLIHTGERPFCCEVCGKRFKENFTLNAHKVIHSKNETRGNEG